MNAGRDVERLIAGWLVEEAPAHAPDRILAESAAQIDRTKQRWFAAAWREPMIISTGRLLVAAAVVLVAVLGAGWLGRASAPAVGAVAPASTIAPSASPSAAASSGPTLGSFRSARDAICTAAMPQIQALNDQLTGLYDAAISDAERSAKIDVLQRVITTGDEIRQQVATLEAPATVATDQAVALARGEDVRAILVREIELLRAGKLSEAEELDLTTGPINGQIESFERRYSLAPCP